MADFEACTLAAAQQNGLITRDQALDLGMSRWMWQSGAAGLLEPVLTSVKRVVTPEPMPFSERRRQRSRAAVMIGGADAAAFGASALRVAGIEGTPLQPGEDVAVDGPWYQRRGVRRHFDGFTEAEVGVDHGTRFLLPLRCLQDAASTFTDAELVAILDSALHLGKLSMPQRDDLRRILPGRVAMIDFADGLRESPLESHAGLLMDLDHITDVVPQVRITVPGFGEVRVDFLIEECVIVECDGREAHDEISTRYHDRHRHEALERMGYIVLRLTWSDVVNHPRATLARIRSALRDADRRGRVRRARAAAAK